MAAAQLVIVGSSGWDYPDWRGSFYPGDLPEDWLLPYYNTQFQAVYLPVGTWQAVSAPTWKRWLDDTRDDFMFVLEPGPPGGAPPAASRLKWATPDWAAAHLWWLDETPDLRALAQRIERHAATGEQLFVFSRCGDLPLLERVATLTQLMGY